MSDVNELIAALSDGDMVKANTTFSDLMSSKINSALDDAKVQMAQSMLGTEEDEDIDDSEYEDDESWDDEGSTEDYEEDEDSDEL